MFTEKMARLTSEFAAQILECLRAASIAELATRERPKKLAAATTKAKTRATPKRPTGPKAASSKAARKTAAPKAAPKVAAKGPPTRETMNAAMSFFAERASKGATAHQLGVHLEDTSGASPSEVIRALVESGAIRDAGFRRSTGTGNKTATVFVTN